MRQRGWHEVPAGSLENDDDVLADVAMCSPERWPEVKADVMRGWVLCSDNRLYHPTVVERAVEAWNAKSEKRWRNECDRMRKDNHRRAKARDANGGAGESDSALPARPVPLQQAEWLR